MKKDIIIGALLLILGFVIGILCRPHRIERVVDIQRDTTILIDTHVIEKPVLVEKHTKDTILVPIRDTVVRNDTVYLPLPREVRIYAEKDYYAEVSGYEPSLDYLEVYSTTKVIKESVTNRNVLGLGIEVQYLGNPYIPIYLEYSHLLQGNAEIYARILYDLPSQSLGIGLGAKVSIGW